jgi:hypothetical protein
MRKTIIISILFLILNSCSAQKIEIKDENLKKAILELGIDKNNNGIFEEDEVNIVTKLKLDEKNISDLSGIEKFKNLTDLNLRKNNITDFSKLNDLLKLEELVIGDNKNNELLDLSKLKNLKGLYAFGLGLKEIKFGSENIKNLYLQDNLFTEFETQNFPDLYTLNLDSCKNLRKLDLSKNANLVQLYLLGTGIENLNIKENIILKTMYIENNVKLEKNEKQERLKPAPIILSK